MPEQQSSARLDAIAQEAGFPDYASWQAWRRNYAARGTGGQGQQTQQAQPEQRNWLQNLVDQIPIHPSSILNHVNSKIRGAFGR